MRDLWQLFEDHLFGVPSTDVLFNQYNSVDHDLDIPGADAIRQDNLRRYLASFTALPDVLVIGEAPGPRGCRFSGVPFTNEVQLTSGQLPFGGRQSSNRTEPHSAYSSHSVWPAMQRYYPRFLLWNAVPMHPHVLGKPLSIRNPSSREVREWAGLLAEMARILRPALVVALGRKAEQALGIVGVDCVYLRHPSQGGLREFREGVPRLFEQGPATREL